MINSMKMAISSSTLSLPSAQIPRPRTSQQQQFLSFSSSNSTFFSTNKTQLMTQWQWKRANCSVDLGRTSKNRVLSVKCLFGLGVPELVVIGGVAALLFGPKQLPEVGRSIGKTVKSFQQAAKEFETELKKEPESPSEAPTKVGEEDERGEGAEHEGELIKLEKK